MDAVVEARSGQGRVLAETRQCTQWQWLETNAEVANAARKALQNVLINGEPGSRVLKGKSDAEVIAIYNRYLDAQAKGAIHQLLLPPGMTNKDFGEIMKWGTGDQAATDRINNLTREELENNGITKEMAKEWRDFYKNVKVQNPSNPSAQGRAELMQKAYQLLGGVD